MATYSYTGSNVWINGSSYITGSINIATNLASVGSYAIQTVSGTLTIDNRVAGSIVNMPIVGVSGTKFAISGIVNQGTNPWVVSGTANVLNRVGGSIVNWPGSLAISNFNALGSSTVVSNFGDLGSSVIIKNNLSLLTGSINIISGTNTQIIAGEAGNQICVYAYKIVCGSTLSLKFKNGGDDFEGFQFYDQNGGAVENVSPPNFLFQTYTGSALNIASTGSIGGRVSYFII